MGGWDHNKYLHSTNSGVGQASSLYSLKVMEQHKLPILETGQSAVHVLHYLIPNLNQYKNRFYIAIHENYQGVPATSTEYMIEAIQEKQRNSNSVIVNGKQ